MINLTMFATEEELCELTGLNHDQLWDAGFDLDDWDVGFCSDEPFTYTDYYEENGECKEFQEPYENCEWLFRRIENYAYGYQHTEYNGKHYYMVYHS